jgi:hypothetical protein
MLEGQELTPRMKLVGVDATFDSACDGLDKRKEKVEGELVRETDPTMRNYLESKLVCIEAEREKTSAARDRSYWILDAEHLQEKPFGHVAKKPHRSIFQWVRENFKRRQSEALVSHVL